MTGDLADRPTILHVSSKSPDNKRYLIIKEIVDTEVQYVNNLQNLNDYIVQPLKDRISTINNNIIKQEEEEKHSWSALIKSLFCCCFAPDLNVGRRRDSMESVALLKPEVNYENDSNRLILTSDQIKEYFTQITLILNINRSFLDDLNKIDYSSIRTDDLSTELRFAELLLFRAHSFKLYTSFISSYSSICESINETKLSNPYFKEFLDNQSKLIRSANNDSSTESTLSGLLISPIQRICRYNLLISELYRTVLEEFVFPTNNETNAISKILEARDLVSKVADHCNSKSKIMSNSARVLSLYKTLGIEDIVKPHRIIIRESEPEDYVKYKKRNKNKIINQINKINSSPCRIHLFNDLLIVSKDQLKRDFVDHEQAQKETIHLLVNIWDDNVNITQRKKSSAIVLQDKMFANKLDVVNQSILVGTMKFVNQQQATSWLESILEQKRIGSNSIL
ncbi:hypothetical protein AKO1_001651 [Acrasis kona]|uniref:DH domain-containing protein n=1 Tax=Acrasis kona TaxID=1008807 RepID=A0AAW2YMW2_9EUKA